MGTKLLFSTTAHPQTDGQTEVVNRSLGALLRALVFENKTSWEECLPIAEFAYNRTKHSTTQQSPFEVVYGFNPLTPLDLSTADLPLSYMVDVGGMEKAKFVQDLHTRVQERIRKMGEQVAQRVNKGRKKMLFNPGDWVWVHFRKIRFPDKARSKLAPRGDGPFMVLERVNDNAYIIDLPGEYNVSCTFNVSDLSPFDFVGDGPDLRTNPSQEGEDDTIMGAVHQTCQPQRDSKGTRPIEMTSKRSSKAINAFIFERGSREYIARLDRSPVERVMADLQKPRESRENTRPGDFEVQNTRPGVFMLSTIGVQKLHPAG